VVIKFGRKPKDKKKKKKEKETAQTARPTLNDC
jgi:hypothetical protein